MQIAGPVAVRAQTAGEGTISGTVTDSTGAAVPNAVVTATNMATNIATQRTSSSSGLFTIAPLQPGIYSLNVEAKGFRTLKQDNLAVNALGVLSVNPVLTVGETTETVEVTAAPPVLDTSTATLGLTMENQTYANLPAPDEQCAARSNGLWILTPGSQGGARLPIIGGTGNYLGQLYLEGIPAETISQQGDNRLVSLAVSVDAVDQFQVVTSTPPAEYSGAGAMNFTMKSGGLQLPRPSLRLRSQHHLRRLELHRQSRSRQRTPLARLSPRPSPSSIRTSSLHPLAARFHSPTRNSSSLSPTTGSMSRKGANSSLYTIPTSPHADRRLHRTKRRVGTGGALRNDRKPRTHLQPTSSSCSGSTCTESLPGNEKRSANQ